MSPKAYCIITAKVSLIIYVVLYQTETLTNKRTRKKNAKLQMF